MDYKKLLANVGTCKGILSQPINEASRPIFDYFFEKLLLLVDVDKELERDSSVASTSVTVPLSDNTNIFKLPKEDYTHLYNITNEFMTDRGYKLKLIMKGVSVSNTAVIACRRLNKS
ncbi:MAG: hypothetical protein ACRC92_02285 [Peptostreptococcaceae bacterium]